MLGLASTNVVHPITDPEQGSSVLSAQRSTTITTPRRSRLQFALSICIAVLDVALGVFAVVQNIMLCEGSRHCFALPASVRWQLGVGTGFICIHRTVSFCVHTTSATGGAWFKIFAVVDAAYLVTCMTLEGFLFVDMEIEDPRDLQLLLPRTCINIGIPAIAVFAMVMAIVCFERR